MARAFRFDDPLARFGVLYAAADVAGAFLETYGRVPDSHGVVTRAALASRALSRVTPARPLRLVDLTGPGLARLRIDARIWSEVPYGTAQAWSRALHDLPGALDGILYASRHDPELRAVALFDRARDALAAERVLGSLMDDPSVLGEMLDRYGFALL